MSVTASPLLEVQSSRSPQGEKQVVRQIPSLRNREVYVAVAAGKSHAEAGQEFGLTQPRVTQIVQQVREWCSQVTHGDGEDFTDLGRLWLAEETLRAQLDGWMRMAMQEWFRTCQEGLGKPVFLNAAMRLSLNLARLHGVDTSGKTARLRAEQ